MNEKLCSRCGVRPPTNKHIWCRECKSENQATNRESHLKQERGQGFGEGVDAMREMLALEFARIGVIRVSGDEVSKAIRLAPRPQLKGS